MGQKVNIGKQKMSVFNRNILTLKDDILDRLIWRANILVSSGEWEIIKPIYASYIWAKFVIKLKRVKSNE